MALDSYTGLKTAIGAWLARVDLAIEADDLIDLFEGWCNRNLRVPQMEQEAVALAAEYMALPVDFLQMRDVQWQGNPRVQLDYLTPMEADIVDPNGIPGTPKRYTIVGDQLRLIPAPNNITTNIRMDYWEKLPPLSISQPTNWLLSLYPDAYLYGSLIHANVRISNPEMAASISGAWQQVMGEIQVAGRNANLGSSLMMRPA